jgi:hypothetical protein
VAPPGEGCNGNRGGESLDSWCGGTSLEEIVVIYATSLRTEAANL